MHYSESQQRRRDRGDQTSADGVVEAVYVTSKAGRGMRPLEEAEAIFGVGLAGDRYFSGEGYYSNKPLPGGGRQLTLIEAEALDEVERETGIRLGGGESRRNLVTTDVRLNALVGRRFYVGEVLCEGIRLCDPCKYLEEITGKPVLRPLVDQGGLRASILLGGTIRVGDHLVPADATDDAVTLATLQG